MKPTDRKLCCNITQINIKHKDRPTARSCLYSEIIEAIQVSIPSVQ